MHLFDYEDNTQTQRSFYITMALASVITYIISGLLLWRISPAYSREQLRNLLRRSPKPQKPPSPPTSPKYTADDKKRKEPRRPSSKAPIASRGRAPSSSSQSGRRQHSTARSRRQSLRQSSRSTKVSGRRRGARSELDLEAGERSIKE